MLGPKVKSKLAMTMCPIEVEAVVEETLCLCAVEVAGDFGMVPDSPPLEQLFLSFQQVLQAWPTGPMPASSPIRLHASQCYYNRSIRSIGRGQTLTGEWTACSSFVWASSSSSHFNFLFVVTWWSPLWVWYEVEVRHLPFVLTWGIDLQQLSLPSIPFSTSSSACFWAASSHSASVISSLFLSISFNLSCFSLSSYSAST